MLFVYSTNRLSETTKSIAKYTQQLQKCQNKLNVVLSTTAAKTEREKTWRWCLDRKTRVNQVCSKYHDKKDAFSWQSVCFWTAHRRPHRVDAYHYGLGQMTTFTSYRPNRAGKAIFMYLHYCRLDFCCCLKLVLVQFLQTDIWMLIHGFRHCC